MGTRKRIDTTCSPSLWELQQPAARATDPSSSLIAAENHEASGRAAAQRDRALRAVRTFPGLTSMELSGIARVGLDRYQLARRLPELEVRGAVKKGAERKCSVTGNRAVTWWVK